MTRHHITYLSANQKTGPITVTRSTTETCPDSCPLLKVITPEGEEKPGPCYDKHGRGNIHREKHDLGLYKSYSPADFIRLVFTFTTVFRNNEGGDLWGKGDWIDPEPTGLFVEACDAAGKLPINYTHKPVAGVHRRGDGKARISNKATLRRVLRYSKSTINISCDNLSEVDRAIDRGFDTVVTLPEDANDAGKVTLTPKGRKVLHCPATWGEVSCGGGMGKGGVYKKPCGGGIPLCAIKGRKFAIGFPAHGSGKKRLTFRILNNLQ